MSSIAAYGTLSAADHGRQLRKAVIAATVGTTIEWYDFFLYGTAAGLVFGKLYFPNSDPTTATLLAFSTYFVGFAARPIGAAIFGHYGDRIGRKATLIATLMLMGIATFLIAFVPTYDSIGIWGGVTLTVLRAVRALASAANGAARCCCRWNGLAPASTTVVSSPPGRNGAFPPAYSCRRLSCSAPPPGPATNS
jgi:MFS family permease